MSFDLKTCAEDRPGDRSDPPVHPRILAFWQDHAGVERILGETGGLAQRGKHGEPDDDEDVALNIDNQMGKVITIPR